MGKTDMMLIGSDSKLSNLNFGCNIDFGGLDIALSSTVRDLGVIFDKNLSLKNQILSAKSKAICGLINISRIAAYINKKQKTQLIHSLVLCQIIFQFGFGIQELSSAVYLNEGSPNWLSRVDSKCKHCTYK